MQQVDAALTADPESSELLTLKADLEQVIELTRTLIEQQKELTVSQVSETSGSTSVQSSSSTSGETYDPDAPTTVDPSTAKKARPHDHLAPVKHWQVGEQCQAIYAKNGQYYEATINEISTDGEVSVTFEQYQGQKHTGVTTLGLLKISTLGFTGSTSSANKKEQLAKQREYLKKKK